MPGFVRGADLARAFYEEVVAHAVRASIFEVEERQLEPSSRLYCEAEKLMDTGSRL
jgi:hypothetical protein